MTRYLSLALGAQEPVFSQSIQQLEQASGRPNADIRLSADLQQRMRQKITQLGLDPEDTTGPELYNALQERLKHDDLQVRSVLNLPGSAITAEILATVTEVVETAEMHKSCFALKAVAAKRLLKKRVPKHAMKRLGYRSLESMLKHEPVANVYAAALISEPASWQKAFYDQYASLQPSDFETRQMHIVMPQSKHWQSLAAEFAETAHHNLMPFKELGVIVVLPVEGRTEGLAVTTLLMALHTMNDIRAYSSYTKLQQVKPMFGELARQAIVTEPSIAARLAGQQVTWRTIHRYYARFKDAYHPEVFEPHVQPEDLSWTQVEDIMAQLEPTLSFWQDTQSLMLLHDGQPVSCNMLDVALNYYNQLPFADRVVHFVRDNVWHELMLKYLNQENLEEAVGRQLSYELVDEYH